MKLKSLIQNMVFVLCVLFSFQAHANIWDDFVEWWGGLGIGLQALSEESSGETEEAPEETTPLVANMEYHLYVDNIEEKSGVVSSTDTPTTTNIKINKGQFFQAKVACFLAEPDGGEYVDGTYVGEYHADDFAFIWSGSEAVDLTKGEFELNNATYSWAFMIVPLDESDDFYATVGVGGDFYVNATCLYDTAMVIHTFNFTLQDSELVVEATPATVEVEEGASSTLIVEFYGDVDECTAQSSGSGPRAGIPMDCSGTLSAVVTSSTGSASGLTATPAATTTKFFDMFVPRYYYHTTYSVTGVTAGTYSIKFTVDGDGYWGQEASDTVQVTVTEAPAGTDADGDGFETGSDCNDADATINSDATEACDGADNNCDGDVDEGFAVFTYYLDADGDGYGTSRVSVSVCSLPVGYVTNQSDCNDTTALINPAHTESCDGLDNNCDGIVDGVDCTVVVDAPVAADPGVVNSGDMTPDVEVNAEPMVVETTGVNVTGGGRGGCSLNVGATADAGFLFFLFGVTFFRFLIKRV